MYYYISLYYHCYHYEYDYYDDDYYYHYYEYYGGRLRRGRLRRPGGRLAAREVQGLPHLAVIMIMMIIIRLTM